MLAKQGGVLRICRTDKPTTKGAGTSITTNKTGKLRGSSVSTAIPCLVWP